MLGIIGDPPLFDSFSPSLQQRSPLQAHFLWRLWFNLFFFGFNVPLEIDDRRPLSFRSPLSWCLILGQPDET